MFLDLDDFRAVHATWHEQSVACLSRGSLEDDDFLLAVSDKERPEGKVLEILLKGVEIPLPNHASFTDHTGTVRDKIRARWWENPENGVTYRDLVFPMDQSIPDVPADDAALAMMPGYPESAPPVFFGHFFKPPAPLQLERANVACLDYSAAKDGPLVAYRWNGCERLRLEHLVTHA